MSSEFHVIIPAKNEAATVATVIHAVRAKLLSLGLSHRVTVVDDGSSDGTATLARASGARVLSPVGSSGLAASFRAGVAAAVDAGSEYIVHLDADGQYDVEDLDRLIDVSAPDALVVGDRLHVQPLGMSTRRYTWNRYLTEAVSDVAGVRLADSQSGLRIFHRDLAKVLTVQSTHTYTQEQIVRAARAGFSVVQPQITFHPRLHGASRLVSTPLSYLARSFADLDAVARELGLMQDPRDDAHKSTVAAASFE